MSGGSHHRYADTAEFYIKDRSVSSYENFYHDGDVVTGGAEAAGSSALGFTLS